MVNKKIIFIAAVLCSITGLFASAGPEGASAVEAPIKTYGTCAICLDEINAQHQDRIVTGDQLFEHCDARHKFHDTCIARWILERFEHHGIIGCPLCRHDVKSDSLLLPLLEAVEHDDVAQIQMLLSQANTFDKKMGVLVGSCLAAVHNHIATVALLFDAEQRGRATALGPYVGYTALMLAVARGHTEIAEILLSTGAHIDDRDNLGLTVLMLAVKNGHIETAAMLLSKGAHIDDRDKIGTTALMLAVACGHTEIAAMLLSKGAHIDGRNDIGATALIYATVHGRTEIAAMLLNNGAHIDARNNDGYTALIYAAAYGRTEITAMLLNKGAHIDARNNDGYTALMHAAANGHTETAAMLLNKGAHIDARDNKGRIALMCAAANGHTKTVAMLLDNHADVSLRDNEGKTTLDHAQAHPEIVALLRAHSAC